jgi:hypothetical protein
MAFLSLGDICSGCCLQSSWRSALEVFLSAWRARYRLGIERRQGLVRSGPGWLRLPIPPAIRVDLRGIALQWAVSRGRYRRFRRFRGGSNSIPGLGLTGSERESSTWAVGGRAGVLVTPRFLTFFDGGFTQARFDGLNYNFAFSGGGPSGLSLAAQTYNGWFIGTGFEYAFTWLPIDGLFLKTEMRYSQYGGNGVSVPLSGSVGGIPVTGAALNSQKATEFISTELVYRFNWFGR